MIVFASRLKWDPGDIVTIDAMQKDVSQGKANVRVVEEATKEEWIKCCSENGMNITERDFRFMQLQGPMFFYRAHED